MRVSWHLFALFALSTAIELSPTVFTPPITADYIVDYYPSSSSAPVFIGNDGSATTGGFRAWSPEGDSLEELWDVRTGRTKVIGVVYDVDGQDLVASWSTQTKLLRFFDVETAEEIEDMQVTVWGDYSVLCTWKSEGGNYVYIFGKRMVRMFKVERSGVLEVQTFALENEPAACAVTRNGTVLYGGENKSIYSFVSSETTSSPPIFKNIKLEDQLTGLAVYFGAAESGEDDYLFTSYEDDIGIFTMDLVELGSLETEDVQFGGVAVYQRATDEFPGGALAYAYEDDDGTAFAVVDLADIWDELGLTVNEEFDPRELVSSSNATTESCSSQGFFAEEACDCFAGFSGDTCDTPTCLNNCSGNGECTGPNTCSCSSGFSGPDCSFAVVRPQYETEAYGGDGDDPSVWIDETDPTKSLIITTIKSEEGAGFAVFDMQGNKLQNITAGEPNNVDVIYGVQLGDRTADLIVAGCRDDETLCFLEVDPETRTLVEIPGGTQPTIDDFKVYGSCTYTSPTTGKKYVFVNSKKAVYLQFELGSEEDGTLTTTLVRQWDAGTGGQVEGCVVDDVNSYLFLGEEEYGLWRYPAEPDSDEAEILIDGVSLPGEPAVEGTSGHLFSDVEGVTLILSADNSTTEGYIVVSTQGVSAFTAYTRVPPHDYVASFTVGESEDGSIDAVTNTDGVTAARGDFGGVFTEGVLVVHDDVNTDPDGKPDLAASFKIVSLGDVLKVLEG